MTPFMFRVAEAAGIVAPEDGGSPELAPTPATRISERVDTGTGADRQVAIRSLAEQLLCEANAVLTDTADRLELIDEVHPHELAFRVAYADRAARISTTFVDGVAYGRLLGTGFESDEPRELEDSDAVPDLIVRLLVGT